MIVWEESAKLNNCSINDLKSRFEQFPKSVKRVLRICEKCGDEKWVKYVDISDGKFCRSCGCSSENSKINRSIAQKKHHDEHPERSIKQKKSFKKYHDEHPEFAQKISDSQTKRYKNLKERILQSERGKKYHREHPGVAKKRGKKISDSEKISGGKDIVDHHISYDFGRPKALVVRITRRFHGQIHNIKGFSCCEHTYSLID